MKDSTELSLGKFTRRERCSFKRGLLQDYSLARRKMGLRCRAGQIPANGVYIGLQEEDIYKLPGNFFPEMSMCLITIEMANFCFTP
jgi:hypothetical protein